VSKREPRWRAVAITLVGVLIMTAIFDNIMISVGLVGYSESKITGVFVGVAPIEDFAYAVAAVVLLPAIWTLRGKPRA
jgi:lycopene cyclase domain-containing protein